MKTIKPIMKRALMLCAMLVACLNLFAYDFEVNGIYYNKLANNEVEVTYSNLYYYGSVVIPENVTYDSTVYSVTSIGYWAFNSCNPLTSVSIPESVTSIGERAFYYCTSLTSVTIPNSVTSIGNEAFYECSSLTSVTIPNSVTLIGYRAFSGCKSLTSINADSDNSAYASASGVLFNKDFTELIQCPGGKRGDYVIPNSVTSIGSGAFGGCSSLTSVTIPNSVSSIGSGAFSGCSSLRYFICLASEPPVVENQIANSKLKRLYVPDASLAAYSSSSWNDWFLTIRPLSELPPAFFELKESSDDSQLLIRPTETKTLSVQFDVTESVIGFQTDITLPEGLSIEETGGKLGIELASGASHTLSAAKVGTGNTYRIVAFSDNNAVFTTGNNLLNIKVKADETFDGGNMEFSETIVSLQGGGSFDAMDYTVKLTAFVYVSRLSVSPAESTLNINETIQLAALITPSNASVKDVTWTSSDPAIATVDENGLVTAVSKGEVTITASTTDGSELTASANITVYSYLCGDANDNGIVSIDDVVTEVQYILEQNPQPFSFENADVNRDERINVVDVTGTVAIILADNNASNAARAIRAANTGSDNLCGEAVQLDSERKGNLILKLQDTDDVTALQADIQLPEGISVVNVRMAGDVNSDHAVRFASLSDNRIRFVCYSLSSTPIDSDSQYIEVELQGDESFTEAYADVYNAYSSDTDCKLGYYNSFPVGITSITTKLEAIEAEGAEPAEVFNMQGVRVGNATDRLPRGIYIIRRGASVSKLKI